MSLSETGPWPSDAGGHVGTVSAGYTPRVRSWEQACC